MSHLTPQEKQVIALIKNNPSLTRKGIAQHLNRAYRPGGTITEHGVKFHLKNAYGKLQVNSRAELVQKLCQERG